MCSPEKKRTYRSGLIGLGVRLKLDLAFDGRVNPSSTIRNLDFVWPDKNK